MSKECGVEGCHKDNIYARGLCYVHWKNAKLNGELDNYPRLKNGMSKEALLERKQIGEWPRRKNPRRANPGAGGPESEKTNYGVPISKRELPEINWQKIKEQTFV